MIGSSSKKQLNYPLQGALLHIPALILIKSVKKNPLFILIYLLNATSRRSCIYMHVILLLFGFPGYTGSYLRPPHANCTSPFYTQGRLDLQTYYLTIYRPPWNISCKITQFCISVLKKRS